MQDDVGECGISVAQKLPVYANKALCQRCKTALARTLTDPDDERDRKRLPFSNLDKGSYIGTVFHKGHESLCDLVWCCFLLIYDGNPVSLDADFFALFFKCLD